MLKSSDRLERRSAAEARGFSTKTPIMPNYLENEATVVADARAGNTEAFTSLVNQYERNIYRLALSITANPEDAEDVLQETFIKVYSHLGQFQSKSRFYTWLVRIAVNESLMKLRGQRRSRHLVSLDEPLKIDQDKVLPHEIVARDENPEECYSQLEVQQFLEEALAQLNPAHRMVFVLRHVQDLSTKETAALLDISVGAVKARLLRARLELRERLSKYFKRPISVREFPIRVLANEPRLRSMPVTHD